MPLGIFALLCIFAASNFQNREPQEHSKIQLPAIRGKVFRSDSGEAISNSYILLTAGKNSVTGAGHFDTRTNEKGEYTFTDIPAGNYTLSIYAWFPKRSDVPCENPCDQKTADGGTITVEWQRKSQAFMEIVRLKDFSVGPGHQRIKDFDLVGK
jgi:hypothetical protein